jgi:PucR family transcriptional regulator, purine catabolism regulatory protein
MLTVADALQLDEFGGAEVVAGAAGLDQPIAWVHNSSVPDVHNWLNGGELVITTVLNMPQDAQQQVEYVQALVARGVVGLVVAVGRHLDNIPESWCYVANANEFPLVAVPYQARFVDLARAVNERIAQESITMVRRALHIHQVVTRLVLDGGGLEDLARVLAELIGQSISIETEHFDALASANIAAIDEARRYTLEHGRTNPLLIKALEAEGILAQIRSTLSPVQLPKMPHVGLGLERILAPIVVHGEIYGYMWIIADGNPLTEIDRMAIESGATVAALMMLHQEAVQTAEASLKGNLLSRLIEGEEDRQSVLTDQALRYGLDLHQPYRMIVLERADDHGTGMRLYRRVNRLMQEQAFGAIVGQFAGQVIVLLTAETDVDAAAEMLYERLEQRDVRVGISAHHRTPEDVPDAYAECHEVLTITWRLSSRQHIACFDQLGYIHALYHAGADSLSGNPHVVLLRRLRQETQADLFHTLEMYLDQGGNATAAADALHIHRSTLNYRLQRIGQITQADLTDPATRFNLQVTLKQIRLFG